ncbi:MAG: hypothetical protein WCD77_06870 [Acidobacteriaceae bacterium]|jgi:hypothetical protein
MRYQFVFAAGAFLASSILWNLAMVAALRFFRIDLPFSLPFRLFRHKQPDLLHAIQGKSINEYVGISGLLLFACPLLAGLTAYDAVARRFIEHPTYGIKDVALSVAWLVLLALCGIWIGIRHWQHSRESGIGFAMAAILALKIAIDAMGASMAIVLLTPAVLVSTFVYFGVRSIKHADRRTRTVSQSSGAESNFVAEQFVPSEEYQAQQAEMAQTLGAAGLNSEQIKRMFLLPVDPPDDKTKKDL